MKLSFALVAIGFAACLSGTVDEPCEKSLPTIEIPKDAIGKDCEIIIKSASSRSIETDAGKIVRFDEKFVVLTHATRTVRVEKKVPVLGQIPYLGGLFRNVGIGTKKVPGELSIQRRNIESFKLKK